MRITISPETEEESMAFSETTYEDVSDFFVCGTASNPDAENENLDFHSWHGKYKALIGNLSYYLLILQDERRAKEGVSIPRSNANNTKKTNLIKFGKEDLREVAKLPEED